MAVLVGVTDREGAVFGDADLSAWAAMPRRDFSILISQSFRLGGVVFMGDVFYSTPVSVPMSSGYTLMMGDFLKWNRAGIFNLYAEKYRRAIHDFDDLAIFRDECLDHGDPMGEVISTYLESYEWAVTGARRESTPTIPSPGTGSRFPREP